MNNIHNVNSSHLELLVAITEQGSFSDAARKLGLTQSAVSHGLARLETELGVILVERGRRGVTLTPAGQEILPHAREVVARLDTIRQITTVSGESASGRLRLGIPPAFPDRPLTEIIAAFRGRFPAVELFLVEDTGLEGKNAIAEGVLDIGMVQHPAPGVDSRLLFQDEIQAVMSPHHSLAVQQTISPEQLFPEALIIPRLGRDRVIGTLRRREGGEGRPQVRHMVNDLQMILSLVRNDMGVALLSRTAFEGAGNRHEGLIALPFCPPLVLPLGIAVRSWEAASPLAKRFVETAMEWANTK